MSGRGNFLRPFPVLYEKKNLLVFYMVRVGILNGSMLVAVTEGEHLEYTTDRCRCSFPPYSPEHSQMFDFHGSVAVCT